MLIETKHTMDPEKASERTNSSEKNLDPTKERKGDESEQSLTSVSTEYHKCPELQKSATEPDAHEQPAIDTDLDTHDDTVQQERAQFYAQYPVSSNGACPYCQSWNVRYLVLQEVKDSGKLPQTLEELLRIGRATVVHRSKAVPEPSSLQCMDCCSGYNIDFSFTNLETIFYWYLRTEKIPEATAASENFDQTGESDLIEVASNKAISKDDDSQCVQVSNDTGFAEWNRDITQWRATQEYWDRKQQRTAKQVDNQPSALDHLLDRIDGKKQGAEAASDTGCDTDTAGAVRDLAPSSWVTSYKDYSVSAQFTEMQGKFAPHSEEEHWRRKGVPTNRSLRQIAHFMDPTQLEEGSSPAHSAAHRYSGGT
eukprot:m.413526 g.413526  ORF g.413526 m.413526 type:complete len:367 (+) comp21265_c0_seq23:378-1478(+)